MSGRHTGSTDLPLTARGEQNAIALKPRLQAISFDAVYSSPLRRALQTAELAGFSRPTITPLLREIDYGEYEGRTSAEIHESRPGWEIYKDGSPGGETPQQVYARAEKFVELVAALGQGRVIAFSHGHFGRAIGVAWIRAGLGIAASLELDVASLSVLRDGDAGRVIALWNSK